MADMEQEQEQEQERDELDRQIRTSKALQMMERELQLPAAVVMPVLLKLLKTFEGNWEHIEDENYRLLADAIFQQQEAEETEKAPGSSSGKKKEKKTMRARRAPRNSKRVESEDSGEDERAQQLVHRRTSNRRTADAFTHAAGMASLGRVVGAKRGRPSLASRSAAAAHDDDDDPAWEPALPLPNPASRTPPSQEPQGAGGRLRRLSTSKAHSVQTQTEAADFEALAYREPIHPAAIVCYQEPGEKEPIAPMPLATWPSVQPMAESSTESPVFLPACQVRKQIFNHISPVKSYAGEVCTKCEKPKPQAMSELRPKSLVFDPSRVKTEGEASQETPLMCLNPEPLQTALPSSSPPLALAAIEPPSPHFQAMEALTPEPLLLMFPSEAVADVGGVGAEAAVAEVPTVEASPIEGTEAVQVDPNSGSSSEPKDAPVVENPSMEVEVEVKIAKSSTKMEEVQQPTENSIIDGALAAIASYISESEDTGHMSPKLESGVTSNVPLEGREGVEERQGNSAHEEAHGIVPDADNISSVAVHADNILPTLVPATVLSQESPSKDSEIITLDVPNPVDGAQADSDAKEESKQLSDNGSSQSSKKRKRHLIKIHQQEQEELEAISEKRKQRHDREDISRGKEKVPVSLSGPKGKDLPKDFFYINSSVVFQGAHVGISMARIGEDDRCSTCVGNCLDNHTPCECTRMTAGEYAYTVEGYLYPHFLKQALEKKVNLNSLAFCQPGACPDERTNDEPCKGHIQRSFIKECWEKCGCTQLCGNRIVQRGIAHRLQVFWTEGGKGWGVRTLEHLPAGTFVCEYVGEILTNTEMWHRNKDVYGTAKHSFALQLDADWCSEQILKDEEALCLDGTYFGNVARFINHRCVDSNLLDIPVEIENPDHHYYHLAFFTSKDVNENEELTWDYGLDFNDKEHQLQAFECVCGSSFCRGKVKDGKPWV